jgi:hypothetical protein
MRFAQLAATPIRFSISYSNADFSFGGSLDVIAESKEEARAKFFEIKPGALITHISEVTPK